MKLKPKHGKFCTVSTYSHRLKHGTIISAATITGYNEELVGTFSDTEKVLPFMFLPNQGKSGYILKYGATSTKAVDDIETFVKSLAANCAIMFLDEKMDEKQAGIETKAMKKWIGRIIPDALGSTKQREAS